MSLNDYHDYEVPKLRAWDVFHRVIQVFKERFLLVLGLTLMGEIIVFFGTAADSRFITLVGQIAGIAAHGAVALVIFKLYHDEDLSFGEAVAKSFSKLPSLLLTSFLLFLIISGVFISLSMIVVAAVMTNNIVVIVILSVGCLALVAYIGAIVGMAVPSCVVERLGAIDSLRRSADLTKGCRFSILVIYFCYFLVVGIIFVLGSAVFVEFFTEYKGLGLKAVRMLSDSELKLAVNKGAMLIFSGLALLIFQLATNTINGSIYLELLIVKRDRDLDEMSQVFE
jgi:hypothetical protein